LAANSRRRDEDAEHGRRQFPELDPALAPLRDQVLFLKHNLNTRAIAGLRADVVTIDAHVNDLLEELDRVIAEADRFIGGLESQAE
jgi:hypothetical protein